MTPPGAQNHPSPDGRQSNYDVICSIVSKKYHPEKSPGGGGCPTGGPRSIRGATISLKIAP